MEVNIGVRWIQGGIISDPPKRLILQQYLCYGCGSGCRLEIPVRDPAPTACLNPERAVRFRQIRESIKETFCSS